MPTGNRIGFSKQLEHHYTKTRVADAEQPLIGVDSMAGRKGLTTVWYDRGGWAFWMLMQAMGRDQMFGGLHHFVEIYRGNPDHPTLHDLFEVLRPFARETAAFNDCVHQWFEQVTLPQFQLSGVERRALEGGRWQVSGKLRNAGTGDVWVDVAAVAGERSAEKAWQEWSTPVFVKAGTTADFLLQTDFGPERVVVDPDVMVLQIGRKGAVAKL